MAYNIQNYWVIGLCPLSGILKKLDNTTFRKLICLRSQVRGRQILRGFLSNFSSECSVFTPQMALALGTKLFQKFSS
jgi:hypothetical protein